MDVPEPKQPQLDPGFAELMEQNKKAGIAAVKARVEGDTNDIMARYGTPTAGDSAAILARYANLFALANAGRYNPAQVV